LCYTKKHIKSLEDDTGYNLMPYKMIWLVPERVIMTQFWGRVTLEDVQGFVDELEAKIEEGTPLIHHISDGLEIEKIEIKLKTFQLFLRGMRPPAKMGWHIEVTRNPINLMISALANQFAHIRYRTFDTVQEAFQFLSTNDETLGNITTQETQ
jgi:hypothetical protein